MIHIVGLPHTSLDEARYTSCAFTAKVARWTRVLKAIGRDCTVYWGGESTNEPVAEFVSCFSLEDQVRYFGEYDPNVLPVIEWHEGFDYWAKFNERALAEVLKRWQPGDYVAIIGGSVQQSIVDTINARGGIVLEPAVGYEGLARGTFACFESYAWMHWVYGKWGIGNGRAFDAVIPQFLEPADFMTGADGGYALFLGRVTQRKGPHAASEIAKAAGIPLKMAGGGAKIDLPTMTIRLADGGEPIAMENTDYLGAVGPLDRRILLAHASVLICPTLYIEPFGTVHAEAMMSGVPVVTPDYGVFTETVGPLDGHRYRMLREAVDGVDASPGLRRPELRERAIGRFSLKAVEPQFANWFDRLDTLHDKGWYA